jgi:hypothetical protein
MLQSAFNNHITFSLKVCDDTTVEFAKSTEWPPKSPNLNALGHHVWNELKQLVYKNQRQLFQSVVLLRQRTEIAS